MHFAESILTVSSRFSLVLESVCCLLEQRKSIPSFILILIESSGCECLVSLVSCQMCLPWRVPLFGIWMGALVLGNMKQ